MNGIVKTFFIIFSPLMRDAAIYEEAQKVDKFVAISKEVKRRIWKYYRRESRCRVPADYHLLNERAEVDGRESDLKESYYLVVSRFVPYKQIDMAIRVFNELPGEKLVIVGIGIMTAKIKKSTQDNIIFKGQVDETELQDPV